MNISPGTMTSSDPSQPTTTATSFTPVQIAFPLPHSARSTNIHLHISNLSRTLLVFLTTSAAGVGADNALENETTGDREGTMPSPVGAPVPLGSFVYAIPDVRSYARPIPVPKLCTILGFINHC